MDGTHCASRLTLKCGCEMKLKHEINQILGKDCNSNKEAARTSTLNNQSQPCQSKTTCVFDGKALSDHTKSEPKIQRNKQPMCEPLLCCQSGWKIQNANKKTTPTTTLTGTAARVKGFCLLVRPGAWHLPCEWDSGSTA